MKVRVKYNSALNDGFTVGQIEYRALNNGSVGLRLDTGLIRNKVAYYIYFDNKQAVYYYPDEVESV